MTEGTTQKILVDTKTFVVKAANEKININLQTIKEYKRVVGVYFFTSNQSMKMSVIDMRIDNQDIFIQQPIEVHTIHSTEEAKGYKVVTFPTSVKAEGSSITGFIQCDNLAINDIIQMCLTCEK